MVQVREPEWGGERLRGLVLRVRESLAATGGGVVIAGRGRLELAAELGLDGVHVSGGDPARVEEARARLGAGALVGYSAHALGELEAAARRGADYLTYSPVLGAFSKEHPLPPTGFAGLAAACAASPIPVYALGGIAPEHAGDVRRAGAAGAAMIGGLAGAADPESAARRFLALWTEAGR